MFTRRTITPNSFNQLISLGVRPSPLSQGRFFSQCTASGSSLFAKRKETAPAALEAEAPAKKKRSSTKKATAEAETAAAAAASEQQAGSASPFAANAHVIEPEQLKIEVIDFTKALVPGEGGRKSKGSDATPVAVTAADINVLQDSIDKLARKYDRLSDKVENLGEISNLMSSNIMMLAEKHVHDNVARILRQNKLVIVNPQAKTNPNSESPADNQALFTKINNEQRLEDYLITFVRDTNVVNADQAIKKSLPKQAFIDVDGHVSNYMDFVQSMSSTWFTLPVGSAKGGRQRLATVGEATVHGNTFAVVRALHRAMRVPVLIRRYTSRVHKAIFAKQSIKESMEGMETLNCFVIVGSVDHKDCAVHPRFFNRTLSTDADFEKLEEHILSTFEGELALPDEDDLFDPAQQFLDSDPLQDATGVWKLLKECELNGAAYSEIQDSEVRDKIALLVLVRIAKACKLRLFFGSVANPLG